MNKKVKSNWMVEFDRELKSMEKPQMEQKQYRSDEDTEFKLNQIAMHYSTEAHPLTRSPVIRALIHSFYYSVFKKEK